MKIERFRPTAAPMAEASSVQLVLVLMNGLLDELMRARTHIEHGRCEAKGRSIRKCSELLATLIHSLDLELGSHAAMQLDRLYDDCNVRLHRADRALDVRMVDEVTGLVTALRDAWQKMEACGV
jgi:flagellar protein FliS